MSARYSIGIDLGTTHSALSYMSVEAMAGRGAGQAVLPVPQITAPGTVEAQQLLPSFLYLSADAEFPAGSMGLPWKGSLKHHGWEVSSVALPGLPVGIDAKVIAAAEVELP